MSSCAACPCPIYRGDPANGRWWSRDRVFRAESSAVRNEGFALRLLILSEWYPSEEAPTLGSFVRDQARAVAVDHEVIVLARDSRRRRGLTGSVSDRIEDGLRTVRLHGPIPPDTTMGRFAWTCMAEHLLRAWRRAGVGPDIMHAHVFSAGFMGLMLSRGSLPLVVSEHHTDFVEGRVVGRQAHVARFVFRHASRVCPVSSVLGRCLEELEPRGRYEIVPNVVDVAEFSPRSPRRAARTGPLRLLLVAMLDRQKGVEHLLDAMAEICRDRHDVTLDIVGDGPSRPALERQARDTSPAGVVTFHGERTRAEVAAFMERSDVFVLPSLVETFGVVVVEALAARLPIITTRAVPLHDQIDGPCGIVVPPGDANALRIAILAMLEHPPVYSSSVAAELARSYSAPVVREQWTTIYREVAQRA